MSKDDTISVIIPVHNWDVTLLIRALAEEIGREGFADQIEVIVADDCSDSEYKDTNRNEISRHSFCRYYEQQERGGRSVVRNFLIRQAQHPFVLLLDADMLPDRKDFLVEYRRRITAENRVLCGGYSYKQRTVRGREYDFYAYKGKKTEEIPAAVRNKTSWRYLFTGNVLVHRDILQQVGFDEHFVGYGYEDTEWAIRLCRSYAVLHIDNTCSHLGLVPKNRAFARMRDSMGNFRRIRDLHPEIFRQTGAGRGARLLAGMPKVLLQGLDLLLVRLFHLLPGSILCFYVFQLDKAVLLALDHDHDGDGHRS